MILNTNDLVTKFNSETFKIVNELSSKGKTPRLVCIGYNVKDDDIKYVNHLTSLSGEFAFDITSEFIKDGDYDALKDAVINSSGDLDVDGILILEPIKDTKAISIIMDNLDESKDIDGFMYNENVKEDNRIPCTAIAVFEILKYYDVDYLNKKITIIGRSKNVGLPLYNMLSDFNAKVNLCHSKTLDLKTETLHSDIIISAVGSLNLITSDMVNKNSTIIDVGINIDSNGDIKGDADFDNLKDYVLSITPVPGGVGSVTSAIMINRVAEFAKRRINNE